MSAQDWLTRAQLAQDRKNKLLSFGPRAKGILTETANGLFVVDPEDAIVSQALLQAGIYNEAEFELCRSFVSPSSNVLIIGTHIGAHTIPLSKKCQTLIAFEANPHTFSLLCVNLALNHCGNVMAFNLAASAQSEKITFLMNRENSGGSKRLPVVSDIAYIYDNPQVVEVDAVSLDQFAESENLPTAYDLILMDIEGSEYFALQGMQHILSESKALSVEFLPHHLTNVSGVTADNFLALILPHFNWLYIPAYNQFVSKEEISQKINAMFHANEAHDGIFFLKELPTVSE